MLECVIHPITYRTPLKKSFLRVNQYKIKYVCSATCLFIFLFNIIIGEYIGYNRQIVTFNCILFAFYFIISTVLIVNIIKTHMEKVDMDMRQDSYNRLQEYTNQIESIANNFLFFFL